MIGSFRIGLLTPSERKNMVIATIEGCLVVAAVQILAGFASVYVLRLGGNLQQVGLLTSLPFLLNAAVLALSAAVSVSAKQALRLSLASAVAHRILMALVPLAPLFGAAAPWWVIAAYSVTAAAMSLSSTYWTAAVSDMFSPQKRGRVFGIRSVFTGIAGFLATLSGGFLLDAFSFPVNFSITFWFATALGVAGAFFLARLEPPSDPDALEAGAPLDRVSIAANARRKSAPAAHWGAIFRGEAGRSFFAVTAPLTMFNIGFFLLSPIMNVYYIEDLEFSNSVVGLLTSSFVLAQVVGSLIWGTLIDRWGNHVVAFATTAGMALQSSILWISPSVLFLAVVQGFGGFCFAGFLLGSFNMIISTGERKYRSQTVTWVNVFGNFSAFVGPLLGTMALTLIGFAPSFFLATAFRALSSLLYYRTARSDLNQILNNRLKLRRPNRRSGLPARAPVEGAADGGRSHASS